MRTDFRRGLFPFGMALVVVSVALAAQLVPSPEEPAAATPPADPTANTPADPQSPGAVILPAPGTPPLDKAKPGDVFSRVDANGDGRLAPEETHSDTRLYNLFEGVDVNKDRYISEDEYRVYGASLDRGAKPAK